MSAIFLVVKIERPSDLAPIRRALHQFDSVSDAPYFEDRSYFPIDPASYSKIRDIYEGDLRRAREASQFRLIHHGAFFVEDPNPDRCPHPTGIRHGQETRCVKPIGHKNRCSPDWNPPRKRGRHEKSVFDPTYRRDS